MLTLIESKMRQENTTYIPVSADMAIYKLIMHIKWSQPDRWKWMVVCPGGMHTIVFYWVHQCLDMDSTGLEEILGATFNGVSNMLNGKAWPKVTRGFRMVVIALLQPFVVSGKTSVDAIQEELDNARKS